LANQLFFGDNLDVLRESIRDESVDLIYLDPPFNSNATYNVLFDSPKGHESTAQIEAFEDTWHWGPQAEKEFTELVGQPNTQVTEVMRALRGFLGENDMMAYLTMMANRLLELHRVLKPTGSLYLHCDPTASHYLKIVLDAVFGTENFRSEIVWKRTSGHSDADRYGPVHDTIFYYVKTDAAVWNQIYQPYDPAYVAQYYRYEDDDGRRFMSGDLGAAGLQGGGYDYVWKNVRRVWRVPVETMKRLDAENRVFYTRNGVPRMKRYLDESKGMPIQDVWTDVESLRSWHDERMGYPTQKPQQLLERIITASSNPSDVVLDPFCGCGTAVHAAQKLGRQWIGIDITHLAISLIEKRLRDAFPGIEFEVHGTPKDYEGARNLAERDKYQFQWWACSLVNAQPYQGKKKGADAGIDGLIFFQDDKSTPKKIVVSVKGGENVGVTMVKDLIATVGRQKAEMGIFVTLAEPTKPMLTEAVAAGYYTTPTGAKFPRIQIHTIADLLSGKARAAYPNLDAGALTFRKAALEQGEDKQSDLFHAAPAKKAKGLGKVAPTARAVPARGRKGRDRG